MNLPNEILNSSKDWRWWKISVTLFFHFGKSQYEDWVGGRGLMWWCSGGGVWCRGVSRCRKIPFLKVFGNFSKILRDFPEIPKILCISHKVGETITIVVVVFWSHTDHFWPIPSHKGSIPVSDTTFTHLQRTWCQKSVWVKSLLTRHHARDTHFWVVSGDSRD